MDTYDPSQYPNAQWAGSGAGAPFDIQPSQYGGGYAATDPAYLGRSSSLGRHRGRSLHRQQGYYPQENGYGTPGYSQPYGSGVTPQMYPTQYLDGDLPPLEEYYDQPPPRPLSRRSSRSRGRYNSQHYPQNYDYDRYYDDDYNRDHYSSRHSRRRHSYDYDDARSHRSYSDRSYSDRTYSDDPYRSYRDYNTYGQYAQPYSTVYPSYGQPTVIHASRTHPTVVPLNGGAGGYVVVPAAGQQVQVVDNRPFLSRLFSPSTWGFGNNQYVPRKRKGYQYFY
ncbi:hypothetical protein CPB84DRAFT_1848904 [Gymnopilus junonius]|uniref:Uncharacterized protein n=1 Tax=Gymnopilus junonius TaxID=109634 RepID=A0A9P5NJ51_GYMJU|nr:hypothetical protein CPB84DRAFT_1848904 [Gymnopilus junonius]